MIFTIAKKYFILLTYQFDIFCDKIFCQIMGSAQMPGYILSEIADLCTASKGVSIYAAPCIFQRDKDCFYFPYIN